jgi:hypothetical protein
MRIQMQINALRYTRYAATAWLLFVTSFGLMRFGDLIYGHAPLVHDVLTYIAEASFGAGCVGIIGLIGMRVFGRALSY